MKKKIKKNATLDNLATQMAKGFKQVTNHLSAKMSEGFHKVNENNDQLARMVSDGFGLVKEELGEIKLDINQLKDGQEQVKLRLDNVAYKFELVEVQRRVAHLEKKAGIRYA